MVFLFVLLMFLVICTIFLLFSKVRIKIENLRFTSVNKKHINDNYEIVIGLYVLNKIPIIKLLINKEKIDKIKANKSLKNKMEKINIKLIQDKDKFDKRILEAFKSLDPNIEQMNLEIQVGTENASLTAIIVPTISTALSIILRKYMKTYKKQNYKVEPIYINQNLINIEISSIFEIKMIHIINIIYILNKKEGVKKYERTSNRRSYDYSYE